MSNQASILTLYHNRFELGSENPCMKETDFQVSQLNDFTTECIRKEKTDYEDNDCFSLVGVCPTRHGGMLDYPKIVTGSAGFVSNKWEHCIQLTSDFNQSLDDQNSSENIFSSVLESANKLMIHHAWLTEVLVKASDFEKIAGVAGGLALIRNKLWQLNDLTVSGMFSGLYRESCDLLESLCQQMTLYYSNTLNTIVIIDSDSDWEESKPFHEGLRVSYCVQMWWYWLETSRQYLWSSLPPNMSQNIFLSVINQSLSTMTHRYSSVSPSSARLTQYRGDILAVLLAVSQLVPCVSEDLASLLSCRPDKVIIRDIHIKCDLLLAILVMVTSPVTSLASCLRSKRAGTDETDWRGLISPGYGNTHTSRLYTITRIISDNPQPNWTLMVQLCISSQSTFPSLLLLQMGAFVPPASPQAGLRCGSVAQCLGACLGAGDTDWSLLVVMGSLLPLVTDESVSPLVLALNPLLTNLSLQSWECLQVTNIWNPRRPVWVSAILNILDPFLSPAVSDVLQRLEEGKTWTLSHVAMARKLLLENVAELLGRRSIIFQKGSLPVSVCGCLLYIRTITPPTVRPLANSAVLQLLVTTVYQSIQSVIPIFRNHRVQKEKVDFLLALCESLCSEDSDLEVLEAALVVRLDLKQLKDLECLPGTMEDPGKEEGTEKFEIIAYNLLQQQQNKIAFMALHRFISYNSDWLGQNLGVIHLNDGNPKLQPWNSLPAPNPKPRQIMQKIGSINFDSLMDITLSWPELCNHVLNSNNIPSLCKFLHLRPAFSETEAPYLPSAELEANLEVQDLLRVMSN